MNSVRDSFRIKGAACGHMGSPFMAALLCGLADGLTTDNAVGARVLGWKGDPSGMADALPLRLAGGLHALVLTGQDADLALAYARTKVSLANQPESLSPNICIMLATAACVAMARHEAFLLRWLDSAPQTNEVRRSAVLIAAGHWLTARFGLQLVLSELGSSAGLNLIWDHYALSVGGETFGPKDARLVLAPDWTGPLPPNSAPVIHARAGVDLNPLDPVDDRLRLLAYFWPDQPDRLERTELALDLAATLRPEIAQGDAIDWLEHRLQQSHIGSLHVVFHTIAWQYFPKAAQDRGLDLLSVAGSRATHDAPLAYLAMEADDAPPSEGAALTLCLWPGAEKLTLARVDFHGRWVRWASVDPSRP